MPIDSPKSQQAEGRLPEQLRATYRRIVEEYEFLTHVRYGRGYVAYEVLADAVLSGWRATEEIHPSSPLVKAGAR